MIKSVFDFRSRFLVIPVINSSTMAEVLATSLARVDLDADVFADSACIVLDVCCDVKKVVRSNTEADSTGAFTSVRHTCLKHCCRDGLCVLEEQVDKG